MRITVVIAALALLSAPLTAAADDKSTPQITPQITPAAANGGYSPPKPKDGHRYPDCFCTDSDGQRIELGRTTCLRIGSQLVLAKCGMSLNNPTWRHIQKGCPTT